MFILPLNYLFSRRDAESAEFTQRIIIHTEPTEQRAQNDACISFAESRWRKT